MKNTIINPRLLNLENISTIDTITSFPIQKIPENREVYNEIFNDLTYVGNPFDDASSQLNFMIIKDEEDKIIQYGYSAINYEVEESCFNLASETEIGELEEILYLVPLLSFEDNPQYHICIRCEYNFFPFGDIIVCDGCVNECCSNNNGYSFFKPISVSVKEWYNNGGYKLNVLYDESNDYLIK